MGTPMAAIWSISALPSALVSSSGWAMGWAAARQCLQARSQDCVTSQMARKGVSSKFNPPRAGMVCIGCIRPPAEARLTGPENGACAGDGAIYPIINEPQDPAGKIISPWEETMLEACG